MADEIVLALSTFPDVETAQRVAREIVELRLAACGNVLPKVHSVYRWQGQVETADEALAIFKLPANGYELFETKLRALHPYDVPEIVSYRVDQGLPDYLRWVTENCQSA